jgi:hypothetical protein
MLTDEDYIDLPEDNELAFVQMEREIRKKHDARIENSEGNSGVYQDTHQEYINETLAAANALEIDHFYAWNTPPEGKEIFDAYRSLSLAVAQFVMQVRIRHSRRLKRYSVALDSATKEKIRHHLNQLKDLAEKLEIPPAKREAIFAKIVALEMEMERARTRFEVVGALILDAATVIGQAGEKLEPWRKWLDSIAGLLGRAKERDVENPALPAPQERRRIEPPKPRPSPMERKPAKGGGKYAWELDDDIPF